jgi:hypothetical protein
MKGTSIALSILALMLSVLMLVSNVAALPTGTGPIQIPTNVGTTLGVPDIWSLTAAPDQRIYGSTGGGTSGHLFYWHANCSNVDDGFFVDLGTLNPVGMSIYALTTSMCINYSTYLNASSTQRASYAIYGGSSAATYDGLGAHLVRYSPYCNCAVWGQDPYWSPGNTIVNNPIDYGAVYSSPSWSAAGGQVPNTPARTIIYQLAPGPCGKVYGGLGYDAYSSTYTQGCTFFAFDPMTQQIVFARSFWPAWYDVLRVNDGRDGKVYFITINFTSSGAVSDSMLWQYDPVVPTCVPILQSSAVVGPNGTSVGYFTDLTWSVDLNNNPRIYLSTSIGYLIMVNPYTPVTYTVLGQVYCPTTPNWTIYCLTTGMFDRIYGGGTDGTHDFFFEMECCCKGWAPGPVSAPNANPVTWGPLPEERVRSIVYGQESRAAAASTTKTPESTLEPE